MNPDIQTLINVFVGGFLPLIVAFVTNAHASGRVKSLVLLFLSAVGGALTQGLSDEGFTIKGAVAAFLVQFGSGVAAHMGLLKPNNITGSESAAANTGLNIGAPSEGG